MSTKYSFWTYLFFIFIWIRFGVAIENDPLSDVEEEVCNDMARIVPALKNPCIVHQIKNRILHDPFGGYYLDGICFYIQHGYFFQDFDINLTAPTISHKSGKDYFLSLFENLQKVTNNFTEYCNDLCSNMNNPRLPTNRANDEAEQSNSNVGDLLQLQNYYRAILLNEAKRSQTAPEQDDIPNLKEDSKLEASPLSLLSSGIPLTQHIHDRTRVLPEIVLQYNDLQRKLLHSLLVTKTGRPLTAIPDELRSQLRVDKVPSLRDRLDLAGAPRLQYNPFSDIRSKLDIKDTIPSISGNNFPSDLGKHQLNPTILPRSKFDLPYINKNTQSPLRNVPSFPSRPISSSVYDNSKVLKSSIVPSPPLISPFLTRTLLAPKTLGTSVPSLPQIFEKYPNLQALLAANRVKPSFPVAFGLNANTEPPAEDEVKKIEQEVISSVDTTSKSPAVIPNDKEDVSSERLDKLEEIEAIVAESTTLENA